MLGRWAEDIGCSVAVASIAIHILIDDRTAVNKTHTLAEKKLFAQLEAYNRGIFVLLDDAPFGLQILSAVGLILGSFDPASSLAEIRLRHFCSIVVSLIPISLFILLRIGLRWRASLSFVCVATAAFGCRFFGLSFVRTNLVSSEPVWIVTVLSGSFAAVMFAHVNNRQSILSTSWTAWLLALSVSLGAALSIKHSSVYPWLCISGVVFYDTWQLWSDLGLKIVCLLRDLTEFVFDLYMNTFSKKPASTVLCAIGVVVAALVFLPPTFFSFSHFAFFRQASNFGPDALAMSSRFVASLKGNFLSSQERRPIAFGSQVAIRQASTTCWLSSSNHLYPVRYRPDAGLEPAEERFSSEQQMVFCSLQKQANNWWIVEQPESFKSSGRFSAFVRDGDLIQLRHGLTGRLLNSHDVSAPSTPNSQEVSCFVDNGLRPQTLWRVSLMHKPNLNATFDAIYDSFELYHANSSLALSISHKVLPAWADFQVEVIAGRDYASVWSIEEHKYKDVRLSKEDLVVSIRNFSALSFWSKLKEVLRIGFDAGI